MNADKIITIVSIALNVAILAWGLYQRVRGNSAAAVSGLIASAEETGLLGSEKMALVVSWLYDMIPAPFKTVLNKKALEALAQSIFNYMKKYANAYIDSKNGKDKDAYKVVNEEVASEIAKKLVDLGPVSLKALASEMGIETNNMEDAEIVLAIVQKLFVKE